MIDYSNEHGEFVGYEGLAIAIIQQAVDDYSHALQTIYDLEDETGEYVTKIINKNKKTVYECLVFFNESTIVNCMISDTQAFIRIINNRINLGQVYDKSKNKWR